MDLMQLDGGTVPAFHISRLRSDRRRMLASSKRCTLPSGGPRSLLSGQNPQPYGLGHLP